MSLSMAALAPLLALGACRAADGTPSDGVYDAVAGVVGDVTMDTQFGELALAANAIAVTSGEVPIGLTAGADGTFLGTRAGATIELRVECQDRLSATLTFDRGSAQPVIDGDHQYSLDLEGQEIVSL
jgi:hypothetical protein